MARDGGDRPDDGRVRVRIHGRHEQAHPLGRPERHLGSMVIEVRGSLREHGIDKRADGFDSPADLAELVRAANEHGFIGMQALAGPRGAEEDLVAEATGQAVGEALDRLRLVAGGLERGDQLEVGHWNAGTWLRESGSGSIARRRPG